MWDIELTLTGHAGPAGTLKAYDAVRLTGAVSDLVYRITRETAGTAGLGRTHRAVERLAQTRLSGLSGDGTTVRFTVGEYDPEGTFPLDFDPLAGQVEGIAGDVVRAMAGNTRPKHLTDTIAAATGALVGALQRAAPHARLRVADRPPVPLVTADLRREVWHPQGHDAPRQEAVQGVLEMVDLHFMHFRLCDAQGRRVELHEITDPDRAARLVGEQVIVRGYYFPPVAAARPRMEDVVVIAVDDAQQMPFGFVTDVDGQVETEPLTDLFTEQDPANGFIAPGAAIAP